MRCETAEAELALSLEMQSVNSPQRRILAIDDDPAMHKLFAAALRRAPVELQSVESVAAARRSIAERRPELILLDLSLNGTSGFGVIGELKKLVGEAVGIVVVSASRDEETQRRVHALGCFGILTKPIRIANFADQITRFLNDCRPGAAGQDPDPVLETLRKQFLDEALRQTAELIRRSDKSLMADRMLQNAAHRWIGASTSIGLPELEVLGRRLEGFARFPPIGGEREIRSALAEVDALLWQAQLSRAF